MTATITDTARAAATAAATDGATADGAPFDPKAFRQALGTFTTGVTIITTRDAAGAPVGLTANSFNSVSLDPPMVLWSLAKSARSLPAFEAAPTWAVHILSAEQEALSNRFASRGEDKFAGVAVEAGIGGLPLLTGCTTRLQCRANFKYEGGDHIIFVGEVLAFDRNDVAPLVYHAGSYAVATRKPPLPAGGSASFGEDFLGFMLSRAYFDIYARVRAVHEAQGLGDAEFFVLTCLLARAGQSPSEMNQLFGLSGRQVEASHVQALAARGLLIVSADPAADAAAGEHAPLHITPAGRELTLHMLAAVKAIESELLAKLGAWEAVSLKALLRRLVQITDIGLPDLWGHGAASASAPTTLPR